MTIRQFIDKGLRSGDTVTVKFHDGRAVTCSFRGYRTYGGTYDLEYALFPVFYAIGRNGFVKRAGPFGDRFVTSFGYDFLKSVKDIHKA